MVYEKIKGSKIFKKTFVIEVYSESHNHRLIDLDVYIPVCILSTDTKVFHRDQLCTIKQPVPKGNSIPISRYGIDYIGKVETNILQKVHICLSSKQPRNVIELSS